MANRCHLLVFKARVCNHAHVYLKTSITYVSCFCLRQPAKCQRGFIYLCVYLSVYFYFLVTSLCILH